MSNGFFSDWLIVRMAKYHTGQLLNWLMQLNFSPLLRGSWRQPKMGVCRIPSPKCQQKKMADPPSPCHKSYLVSFQFLKENLLFRMKFSIWKLFWQVLGTQMKEQGPTQHRPMAQPVVFIYLSYSTTFTENAVHCLRRWFVLVCSVRGQSVSHPPTGWPHDHGPTNVEPMGKRRMETECWVNTCNTQWYLVTFY